MIFPPYPTFKKYSPNNKENSNYRQVDPIKMANNNGQFGTV